MSDFPVALAVIVVAYNSPELLRENLAPAGLEALPARIVVVDNSDQQAMRDATASLCAQRAWDYLPSPRNVGFGAGANAGVSRALAAGATTFLLLNPDAWLDVETARALWLACEQSPLAALSPVIKRPDGSIWFSRGRILMHRGRLRSSARPEEDDGPKWLTGASLVVSRELWERVGGFDERYFLYWEDVDLSWRILRAGGGLVVRADLGAYHAVGATQAGSAKSSTFVYYNCRNRLRFAAAHLTRRQRLDWLLGTPRLTWELIGLGGRTRASWAAGLWGTGAGLALVLFPSLARRSTRAR